jgi:hypothetical protein
VEAGRAKRAGDLPDRTSEIFFRRGLDDEANHLATLAQIAACVKAICDASQTVGAKQR